jgi:hypothetical protein
MLGITALIKYILQRYISIGTPLKVKQWGNHMSLADWFSQGNKSKKNSKLFLFTTVQALFTLLSVTWL